MSVLALIVVVIPIGFYLGFGRMFFQRRSCIVITVATGVGLSAAIYYSPWLAGTDWKTTAVLATPAYQFLLLRSMGKAHEEATGKPIEAVFFSNRATAIASSRTFRLNLSYYLLSIGAPALIIANL